MGHLARSALQLDGGDCPPVRFVIWSWPSAPIKGLLRDVRVKAQRSQPEAVFLARFLAELDPADRVSLFGSSYGARIVTGALHVLAGGTLNGCSIPANSSFHPARVVLTAAALDNDWLLPGRYHGLALSQVDAMLVFYNPLDPVLKMYDFVDKCTHDKALGFTGLITSPSAYEWADRYEEQNVGRMIGHVHSASYYFHSSCLMRQARRYLLWEPLE